MRKRGPRQDLRQDKSTGQWYYRYDGHKKFFGTDYHAAKDRWLEYETRRRIPTDYLERASKEIQLFGVPETEITLDVLQSWVSLMGKQDKQRDFLRDTLGCTSADISDPDTWSMLWRIGPVDTPTQTKGDTFGTICAAYLAYCKTKTGSHHAKDANNTLKRWKKHIPSTTPIAKLTAEQVTGLLEDFLALVKKQKQWVDKQPKPIPVAILIKQAPGMSPSYYNKLVAVLKAAINCYADKHSLPNKDALVKCLSTIPIRKRELRLVTKDDFAVMLANLPLKWQCMVLLAANCAYSNIDVAHITWHNLRDGYIEYQRSKTEDRDCGMRRTPLWKKTIDKLAEWRKVCPSQHYIFTTRSGNPYISVSGNGDTGSDVANVKDSLSQQFNEQLKDIGLVQRVDDKVYPLFPFGTFRKTATTYAVMGGATEIAVKMLLGDCPNEIWRHYGQAVPECIKTAVAGIGSYLGVK